MTISHSSCLCVVAETGFIKDRNDEHSAFSGNKEPELAVACTAGAPAMHTFCEEMRESDGGLAWAASVNAC